MKQRVFKFLNLASTYLLMVVLCLVVIGHDNGASDDPIWRIRAFTRMKEFDYIQWTMDAWVQKNTQTALSAPRYLSVDEQRQVVLQYLDLVSKMDNILNQVYKIYTDPQEKNPAETARDLIRQYREYQRLEKRLGPMAEAVFQDQISYILNDAGLTVGGQPLPPVLYHVTPLPDALIISPRSVIRQDANISLSPGLTLPEKNELEEKVSKSQDVSALVVDIGGVGVYPTMVMSTTDINWLAEVVSHEWTHNYLTLRPLGLNYSTTPELRTINETTANLVGNEIGKAMIARYYPEFVPPPPPETKPNDNQPSQPASPPKFDYNKEMHITRVAADELLKEGKVDEAERYMEQRRQVFWDNGYQIRKLNQAYFAFYGAYNDQPGGGASGQDPVGPAVQALRAKSASLRDFLNQISWVTSFQQLQKMIDEPTR